MNLFLHRNSYCLVIIGALFLTVLSQIPHYQYNDGNSETNGMTNLNDLTMRPSIQEILKVENQLEPYTTNPTLALFPETIPFEINIVFAGIPSAIVNESYLLNSLPDHSQISRYFPLSYGFETFIDYSLNYNFYYLSNDTTIDMSNHISNYGSFTFPSEMGIYWSNRTLETKYERCSISGARSFLSTEATSLKTEDGSYISIEKSDPTLFITNFFINNSNFIVDNNASTSWFSNAVPHVYYLDKADMDTNRISALRNYGRYAPGFDWVDAAWMLIDTSSGPSSYEDISTKHTNFIDYLYGSVNTSDINMEYLELIRSVAFSRFVPTFLYEPMWAENIELGIALFQDNGTDMTPFLSTTKIKDEFEKLFPFANVTIIFSNNFIYDNDEIDTYLDYIDSYSTYPSWATQLVDFLDLKNVEYFGNEIPYNHTIRHIVGVFATNRINGKDAALGFTYAPYGSNTALGSVVTITPDTINGDGEGLTQTTIHELGHSVSLRHPHDYRLDGNLEKAWVWDVSESPLTYLHSVFDWNFLDKQIIHRGQYRYLFNKTQYLFDTINTTLINKNFPSGYYPSKFHEDLTNISFSFNESIDYFILNDYDTALETLINCFLDLKFVLINVANLERYFPPITNFVNVNNSNVDYGNIIHISGNIVSYGKPNVSVDSNGFVTEAKIDVLHNETFLYETTFSLSVPTITWNNSEQDIDLPIYIYDDIKYYRHSLLFKLLLLKARIISPTNAMSLNLKHATTLKIIGKYFSADNNSRLQIIYGPYWHVEDHTNDYDPFWYDLNKSSGDHWEFIANISHFENGQNSIKVRIYNGNFSYTDTINFNVRGLPEILVNTSKSPDITGPTSDKKSPPIIDPPYTLLLLGLGSVLVLSVIGSRRLYLQRQHSQILTKSLSQTESSKIVQARSDIIRKIDQLQDERTLKTGKRTFKPKRRGGKP